MNDPRPKHAVLAHCCAVDVRAHPAACLSEVTVLQAMLRDNEADSSKHLMCALCALLVGPHRRTGTGPDWCGVENGRRSISRTDSISSLNVLDFVCLHRSRHVLHRRAPCLCSNMWGTGVVRGDGTVPVRSTVACCCISVESCLQLCHASNMHANKQPAQP